MTTMPSEDLSRARDRRALNLYESGLTLHKIGSDLDISTERVSEIVWRARCYRLSVLLEVIWNVSQVDAKECAILCLLASKAQGHKSAVPKRRERFEEYADRVRFRLGFHVYPDGCSSETARGQFRKGYLRGKRDVAQGNAFDDYGPLWVVKGYVRGYYQAIATLPVVPFETERQRRTV